MLLRLFEAEGDIEIDGQKIKNVTQNSLRTEIGLVPQDVTLFNESIKANLEYAKQGASMKEIITATTMAEIHEKILTFTDGYDTVVGERGLKLSGGEKQRIAIARMILKNPKIILMDEATSALDSATEKSIQACFKKLSMNRTSLIVAHRLSTIMDADLIIVLKNGEIIEKGCHNELLEQNGIYKNLWSQQSNKPSFLSENDAGSRKLL